MVTRLVTLAVMAAAACAGSTRPPAAGPPASGTAEPAASVDPVALADSLRNSFTAADVEFMAGMIHHHAQALVMARMIPTHTSNGPLQVLAGRIIVGQNDEIAIMQNWLRNNGQPVPEPDTTAAAGPHAMHAGGHGEHELMPGMLTAEQMAQLEAARGPEFDRLFLTFMIQHHQGAITMVDQLFDTYGAAQNDLVFKIASDIGADQTSEIDRMQSMLREMVFGPTGPQ